MWSRVNMNRNWSGVWHAQVKQLRAPTVRYTPLWRWILLSSSWCACVCARYVYTFLSIQIHWQRTTTKENQKIYSTHIQRQRSIRQSHRPRFRIIARWNEVHSLYASDIYMYMHISVCVYQCIFIKLSLWR